MKQILILEDDSEAQEIYRITLGDRYSLSFSSSISEFSEALRKITSANGPSLIIADLRLPDGNFLDFLIRSPDALADKVPFLIISSLDDYQVLESCFNEGAIDYLTKPFTKSELQVKVDRFFSSPKSVNSRGPILDPFSFSLKRNEGETVLLTPKELQIYNLLKSCSGPIHRTELINKIWSKISVTEKTLDVHLFNLRKKLNIVGQTIRFVEPQSYILSEAGVNFPFGGDMAATS